MQMLLEKSDIDVNKAINDSSPSCDRWSYQSYHGMTPLMMASKPGGTEMVELLLSRPELDVNLALDTGPGRCVGFDGQGATALSIASKYGKNKVVKLLLANNRTLVNKVDAVGRTPLSVACEMGREEVVELLLSYPETDVTKPDDSGQTPLMKAASGHGEYQVVTLLLRCPKTDFELAALHWAKSVKRDRLMEMIEFRSNLMKLGHTCRSNRFG